MLCLGFVVCRFVECMCLLFVACLFGLCLPELDVCVVGCDYFFICCLLCEIQAKVPLYIFQMCVCYCSLFFTVCWCDFPFKLI